MPRSGLTVPILLVACAFLYSQDPPLPTDWGLLAAELRPLVEQAAERCRKDPRDPEALAALGRLYHGNGVSALAAAAYERALPIGGGDAKTLYFLGLIREETGEATAAIDLFRRARELQPAYAPLRYHLGNVLLDVSRPADAAVEFREAVRLAPSETTFRVGFARALRHAGSLPEALAAVDEALRAAPDDPAANQIAALILKGLGRGDAAASRLAKARTYRAGIVRDPWFREVQRLGATVAGALSQAEFFLEAGKPDGAVKTLEPLAKANPGRADVHRALARAHAAGGQLPRAKDAYLRAIEIEPGDARTRGDLASVLLDLGDADGAARHASAALESEPALDSARAIRAAASLRKGDAAGALADVDPIVLARPDDVLAQVVRGDALLALGRAAEAVAAFEAALRVNPGLAYARTRLEAARAAASKRPESR